MADVGKAVQKAVKPTRKTDEEERNDIIGLVLGCLLTSAGAAFTGFFGHKVHQNRVAKK